MCRTMKPLTTLPLLGWVLMQGLTSALRGPPKLSAYLGRTLSVACQYEEGYQMYEKYWCKGSDWRSCTIVVRTKGTETEATSGRTSIQDNWTRSEFIVRLENFAQEDAGIYWCGITRVGSDLGFHIEITALPAGTLPTTEQSATLPSVETTCEVLYQVTVALLILSGLKTAILLCLVFGFIWMCRSSST